MNIRNFAMVSKVIFGRGSYKKLSEIIYPQRKYETGKAIYLVDHVFEKKQFPYTIIENKDDYLEFVDVTHEPKTSYVDYLRDRCIDLSKGIPSIIVGIGGGSTLDIAKAVSLMITNPGSSKDYQGWDLINNKGIYHVGIPTLSGTGSEVSRTSVLTGPSKKLGLNSDFTLFDQVVLDPELLKDVPKNQRFYTGMDCYIHCIESLSGTFINAFSQSYGEKALSLIQEVFLSKSTWDEDSDEKLMMASWHGGMSIAYSQVGVAHALSYGLSYVLGIKHGIGNCIVFNKISEFYPKGVSEFKKMVEIHEIEIPEGVCSSCSDGEFETMINVAMDMTPLWENALGKNWKELITAKKLRKIYEQM